MPTARFVINKTSRYLINDTLCVIMIYLYFDNLTYTKLAIFIEFFGLFVLLPLYFILKLSFEGTSEISSPLLSFYHRLIINPTLMIILIAGLFYQEKHVTNSR